VIVIKGEPQVRLAVDTGPEQPPTRAVWLGTILKDRVLAGQYRPGERIREGDLQREFGLSNGPIREALQGLIAEGLAEKSPWQGVSVIDLSDREIVELFQIRLALMEYAAERAALEAPAEVLQQAPALKAAVERAFGEVRAGAASPSGNRQLSRWILAGAGNQMMTKAWDRTVGMSHIYVNTLLRSDDEANNVRIIHALIDAIVARDPAAARARVRELTAKTVSGLGIGGGAL